MKLTVQLEVGNRVVQEQVTIPGDTRADWRDIINTATIRLELSTYGPPGPVPAMTAEDKPFAYQTPRG